MIEMNDSSYQGKELDIFRHAMHWKKYWSFIVKPYINGDVLEVGAGIGENTLLFQNADWSTWVCLEPDKQLAMRIESTLESVGIAYRYEVITGTLLGVDKNQKFDTILYIDVLEHIEDHEAELKHAALRLKEGGRLIILSPAHQMLYTPFDHSIGHFRRYNKELLASVVPDKFVREKLIYLDCVGLIASLGNRIFLRQKMPSLRQIRIWDRFMVPVSQVLDKWFFYCIGKTIIGIWEKPPPIYFERKI